MKYSLLILWIPLLLSISSCQRGNPSGEGSLKQVVEETPGESGDITLTREQFESGIVTAIDARISSNQLLQATTNYLQARYELVLRSKILEVYQGKAISL